MKNEDLKAVFSNLDNMLSNVDISDVNADSSVYSELKDGYYLCEVVKAELKSSSNGDAMVAFRFKIVEDGIDVEMDEKGHVHFKEIKKSKDQLVFLNYVLKDETKIKRFVIDMLKFEGDTPGEPLLPKECFLTSETIEDAIEALIGYRIYVQISTTEKNDGSKSTWTNLVSWKRVNALELPVD